MSLKSWILGRVHRLNGLAGRSDLPPREPALGPADPVHPVRGPVRDPVAPFDAPAQRHVTEPTLSDAEHLGAYGPLIGMIRDELEHFVVSQVRLHLAIADRDRFLLTSIGVGCAGADEARQLLHRFMHEFKPEQVKRYLVREVIGALPNAAAIDLTQFAGLFDADARKDLEEDGEFAELLAALRSPPTSTAQPSYRVSIVGRWTELDAARPAAAAASVNSAATPTTPLAGQRCEFDVEDGDGRRRVVLQAVVPGRRYTVGKGDGCDIRVAGTYASRRHAELWLDDGWWAADAGSTNGVRIESPFGAHDPSGASTAQVADRPVRLSDGARVVLSARAEGPASDYPWVALRPAAHADARITPIAATGAAPKTPLTAILAERSAGDVFKITALQVAGVRTLEVRPSSLPVTVGRSRNQTLVVDRRHEGVSGHHLDIVELDESGAEIEVHGDNGVLIEGVPHASGARLRWHLGETMVLGASAHDDPTCTLTLTRQD